VVVREQLRDAGVLRLLEGLFFTQKRLGTRGKVPVVLRLRIQTHVDDNVDICNEVSDAGREAVMICGHNTPPRHRLRSTVSIHRSLGDAVAAIIER